jgi:polysaccharide pyruvyl transferase CsaB
MFAGLWRRWKARRIHGAIKNARRRRKVRIALLGWYGSPNVGDEAVLASILHTLRGESDISITIMSTNPQRTAVSHPQLRSVNRSLLRAESWRTLFNSKALVLGGGGLLQDRSSIYNMPSFVAYILLARLFGKKVMLWGLGAEPLETSLGRWLARRAINLSHVVSLRDEASKEILLRAHVNEHKLKVTTDPALLLQPASKVEAEAILAEAKAALDERLAVAFCLRKLPDDQPGMHLGYVLSVSLRERLNRMSRRGRGRTAFFTKLMANLADHMVEQHGAPVLFVPFWAGRDDVYMEQIVRQMRNPAAARVLHGQYQPEVMVALIGQMQMVVAMRLHAAIFAAGQGVPPLAITYAQKVRGFMQSIGMEQQSISIERLDGELIESKADDIWQNRAAFSEQIKPKVEALRQIGMLERVWLRDLLRLPND